MKISYNWLKQYLPLTLSPEETAEVLTSIGLEVEGLEAIDSIPGGLRGVIVGEVKTCQKHPNADKLSLTQVDVGQAEWLQIVCGAPNVAAGQKVLVATVGTTLHPTGGEPLKISKGKIRGETSEGMICAEDELGLGHDHAGILVLPPATPIGLPAAEYFNLERDYVIEIGLTPNRSDATNHLGVARDLAAALRIHHGLQEPLQLPTLSTLDPAAGGSTAMAVEVVDAAACPRYVGICLDGVTVQDSPEWLQRRLQAIGVRPINNLVDITNYVLHELGQPLHAFDWDKIGGQKIVVRTLPAGTPFTTLDGVQRQLDAEDLMICDGNQQGLCLAGVFGGQHSGITSGTTRVFLESAHFRPQTIRRTSMRHNLRTDAAKIYEKGSDPNVAVLALQRAVQLMQELAGARVSSPLIDHYPQPIQPAEVEVAYEYVNRLIGVELAQEEVLDILAALEMPIVDTTRDTFTVAVPTNKIDVTRPADVVEEILRIYGFNQVGLEEKFSITAALSPKPDPTQVRNTIGDFLAANGFNEIMALSLSQSRYYTQVLPNWEAEELVYINNTSNMHLDIMRPDLVVSALETVLHNQNRQQNRLRFFEFGKTYRRQGEKIVERNELSLTLVGERYAENWLLSNPYAETGSKTPFYALKAQVQQVLGRLGLEGFQETALHNEVFAYALQYHRGPQVLVTLGRLQPGVVKASEVRGAVYFANFDWDLVLQSLRKQTVTYQEVSKFPSTRRDLALIVDNSIKFGDIVAIARKIGKKLIKEINLFDVYENEQQLGADKRSYAVSYLFEDAEKTLNDKEVDGVMTQLIKTYESNLGAQIRR